MVRYEGCGLRMPVSWPFEVVMLSNHMNKFIDLLAGRWFLWAGQYSSKYIRGSVQVARVTPMKVARASGDVLVANSKRR